MMKHIFMILGNIFSILYPMSLAEKFNIVRRVVYSSYLKRFFASMGNDTYFEYKASRLVGLKHISIGERCIFGKNIQLTAWDEYYGQRFSPEIIIGQGCNFGDENHITACNRIVIGNNVLTGPNVFVSDNSHGRTLYDDMLLPPVERTLHLRGCVEIGDNVWIGRNACIMPGVKIGKNSIIGANSVVTRDIPAFSVAVGVPAKVIRTVMPE